MLNGAGCCWIWFECSNLTFNIVSYFFCSGVRWPQCWMGERSIKLAPFPRKSRLPHFFHPWLSRIPLFFFEKVQLLPKRINVRCRWALSIYVLPLHLCFTFLVNNRLRIHSFYTRPYSTKSDDAKQWHCLTTSLQLVGRPKRTVRFLKCVEVINKNAGTSFKASLSQIFKQYPCEAILVTICLSGG